MSLRVRRPLRAAGSQAGGAGKTSTRQALLCASLAALLLGGCASAPPDGAEPALAPAPLPPEPYTVPPDPYAGTAPPLPGMPGSQERSWRLTGDRAVRPAQVTDDGTRTFVLFAPEQALAAVFAIGPTGEEEVVNGQMRGAAYVIDRVYERLVFRIDRDRAVATRPKDKR